MASFLSNYTLDALLNWMFRGSAMPSAPATVYAEAFTVAPAADGTGERLLQAPDMREWPSPVTPPIGRRPTRPRGSVVSAMPLPRRLRQQAATGQGQLWALAGMTPPPAATCSPMKT